MQSFFLDLPYAFPGEPEARPYLVERHGLFAIESEVQLDDFRLASHEGTERRVDLTSQAATHHPVLR